jgi:molybdopterin synthase sulfur carrier subunit
MSQRSRHPDGMARLRLFAAARDAAGTGAATVDGATVGEVMANASASFGPDFVAVLATCRIWVNGDPAEADQPVADHDEVAVLPPVSGG